MLPVAVVMPVHVPGPDFRRALQALARSVVRPDEMVVVVDGARGASEPEIPELPFRLRVIHTGHPAGPARARNLGARATEAELLMFVDADVVLAPDVLGRVRRAFERDPDLTALIGSYDDAPGDPGFLSQYRNLLHHYTHHAAHPDVTTFWGACGAVRRDAFLAVGGFDETYERPSIEDIELGYRLTDAGHRIRLEREIQAKHLKRWTASTMLRTDILDRALPWSDLLLSRGGGDRNLNLDLRSRVSVVAGFGLIGASLGALSFPPAALLALGLALLLLWLNAPFYVYLARKRSPVFALRAVPWHWLYFISGGTGFALGCLRHVSRRLRTAGRVP